MSEAKTVLIIDDDVAFADFLRAAVESVGHRAVVCHDGSRGLDVFREVKPQLVLLDILLPKRDGFQVCQDIRGDELGADVPLVMLTGIYKKPVYEREALDIYKASAYMYKPVQVPDLWSMLERYLGSVQGDARPMPADDSTDLSEVALATVLAEHLDKCSSGVLFIRGITESHAIYVRHGEPFFVRSNVETSRLHEVLLQTWQVTHTQVEEALEHVASSRGHLRLGQALVELGALTEEQFRAALQLQLQIVLKNAFALNEGTAFFAPGIPPSAEDLPLELAPKAILMMGARFAGSTAAVSASLPPRSAKLHAAAEASALVEELKLPPIERALLETITGEQTVEQFLAIASCAGVDGAKLLFGFTLVGLVSHENSRETDAEAGCPYPEWDSERWSKLSVGATLMDLHRRQATGTLDVRADGCPATKSLTFRAGDLMSVRSSVEEDGLEDMVLNLQLVDEDVLSGIIDGLGADAGDLELGRALVLSGKTTPMQLYWAAVYQAQAAAVGLLGLRGCSLTWTDGATCEGSVSLPDIPTAEIVWEATRCLSGPELRTLLPGKQTWFKASAEDPTALGKIPIPEGAQALYSQLETPATLEKLLKEGPVKGDEFRRFVHGLVACRLAEACDAPTAETPPACTAIDVSCEESPPEPEPSSTPEPEETPEPAVVASTAPDVQAGPVEPEPAPNVASQGSGDDAFMDMLFGGDEPMEAPSPPAVPSLTGDSEDADPAQDSESNEASSTEQEDSSPEFIPADLCATRDLLADIAVGLKSMHAMGRTLVPDLAKSGERVDVERGVLRQLLSTVADLSARAESLERILNKGESSDRESPLVPDDAGVCS